MYFSWLDSGSVTFPYFQKPCLALVIQPSEDTYFRVMAVAGDKKHVQFEQLGEKEREGGKVQADHMQAHPCNDCNLPEEGQGIGQGERFPKGD